jgi:prepilin-type N-terminal cleavage/methylation domain-containing protein
MKKKKGFTLVELSIVLVIIGLLIGGILVGQSLIESAKIKAVIKQISQYDIAMSTFITKYNQLPGDATIFGVYYPSTPWRFNNNRLSDGAGYEAGRAWRHLSQGVGIKNVHGTNYQEFDPFGPPYSEINDSQCPRLLKIDQNPEATTPCLTITFNPVFGGTGYYTYNAGPPAIIPQVRGIMSPITLLALDTKLDDGTAALHASGGKVWANNIGSGCFSGTSYLISKDYGCQFVRIRIGIDTGVNN